jgi:MFS superfamily sulfate permease-like transporter
MRTLVSSAQPHPLALLLDLSESPGLDVETVDALREPAGELSTQGTELVLTAVRTPVLAMLDRAGLTERIRIEPTLDAAVPARRSPDPDVAGSPEPG